MRLVCISDTHEKHEELGELPVGDVLIHAGDATLMGEEEPTMKFLDWFLEQPHKYKLFVPGNHDFFFDKDADRRRMDLWRKGLYDTDPKVVHILIDKMIEIEGIKFWGSPWTRRYGEWAFMRSEMDLMEIYSKMPPHDVLISHGPPYGIQDSFPGGRFKSGEEHVGSTALLKHVRRIKPLAVICGHIHEARGHNHIIHDSYKKVTGVFNVSSVNRAHKLYEQGPYVLDIEKELKISLA